MCVCVCVYIYDHSFIVGDDSTPRPTGLPGPNVDQGDTLEGSGIGIPGKQLKQMMLQHAMLYCSSVKQ